MTIPVTTRAGKGSPLTPTEMDTNLINVARDSTESVQGNVRLATAAEAQGLTDLTLALSPGRFAYSLEKYFQNSAAIDIVNNPAGFFKVTNGPYVQWGNVVRNSNTNVPLINFYKPMSQVYFITCIDANATGGNGYVPKPTNVNGNGFTLTTDFFSGTIATVQTFWLVIGL